MKQFNNETTSGFTLIELLIVIGISVILASASVPIYGSLQVSTQLNENSSLIIQNIRIAREKSVAGLNDVQHGVYFDINPGGIDKYILYQGSSYALRNTAYDLETDLGDVLSLSSSGFTLIGNDIDINFSKGLGVPDNIGTITLTHEVSGSRQIILNSFGVVEEN